MEPYTTAASIDEQAQGWLARVAPYNRTQLVLNPGQAALLVVDMQKFFLDPQSQTFTCGGPAILPNARRLISAFRAAGRPVIYTKHVHSADLSDAGILAWWWKGMCIEGSPESEMADALAPQPGEKVIHKHRYSAFYNTDLETVLRCLNIQDLVISGIMTNMCCESTARDAYYRDYRVFFPADGTGSLNEELHVASLLNLALGFASITSVARLLTELGQTAGVVDCERVTQPWES
jgi:ureidoacrylate peracid hydrolase